MMTEISDLRAQGSGLRAKSRVPSAGLRAEGKVPRAEHRAKKHLGAI